MGRKRIKWESGFIVIRSGTVQDDVNGQLIESKLLNAAPEDGAGLYRQFGQLCSQAEESQGLPFKPELMTKADLLTLQSAYDAFTRMARSLRDKWTTAQARLNTDDGVVVEDDWEQNPDPKSPAAPSLGGTTLGIGSD